MCDHHFPGKVCIPDPSRIRADGTGVPVISLDANNGDVFIGGPPGGSGHRGRLILVNAAGEKTYEIDGETGTTSQNGDIVLLDAAGNERVRISGQNAAIMVKTAGEADVIHLDGKTGQVTVGGNGEDGVVAVNSASNATTIHLDGASGEVTADGSVTTEELAVGGTATILDLTVGNGTATQDLTVSNSASINELMVDNGTITQTLMINDTATAQDLTVNGETSVRDIAVGGNLSVENTTGSPTIQMNGNTGNISLNGEIIIKDWSISVPDYVFAENYKLRKLDDLAAYVGANHHLPEVPSAAEVAENGVNVGEFCMLLLKKVEEMSLYTIQLQDALREQQLRLQELESESSVRH